MDKKQEAQMRLVREEELFLIDGGDTSKSSGYAFCEAIVQGIINIFKS